MRADWKPADRKTFSEKLKAITGMAEIVTATAQNVNFVSSCASR